MSTSLETPEVIFAFTQACLKMNAMVFKRSVFESRRRPKGILRPKIKPHLKDIAQVSNLKQGGLARSQLVIQQSCCCCCYFHFC